MTADQHVTTDQRGEPLLPSVEGIRALADLCRQRGVSWLEASDGDWSIRLELDAAAAPDSMEAPPVREEIAPAPNPAIVHSDWVGIFHRTEDSDSAPFVAEGQRVAATDVIGAIEAMGLQHSQLAGRDGRIVRFLVEDGTPVEYGQPLLEVE